MRYIKRLFRNNKGQLLVELLLAFGLAAIILPGILVAVIASRDGKAQQGQRFTAISLLKQTNEAIRSVREQGWENVPATGEYHPALSGGAWSLVAGSTTVDGFTVSVTFSQVYRSANAIVLSPTPGTLDNSTKRAEVTISWSDPLPSSIDSTLYFTRYLENDSYTETTQAHFNAGTKTGTTVQSTSPPAVTDDGQVILGSGGNSDWCSPSLVSYTLDLPGQGYASSITAIEGKAFAGTGENASGMAYMDINISNANPPVPTLGNTFDGFKTNGVFGESGYAYISTDTNSKEVVIIALSGNPYTEVGYFDAPGNSSADGIFVSNNVGYTTVGNKFYNFNLSSKSGSRPILDTDGVTLAGNGTDIYIIGTYAYVSTDASSAEMQIVNISNPTSLSVVGSVNTNSAAGVDVFVDSSGNRAYLVTAASASQREFFIVNTTSKSSPTLVSGGTFEANGMNPKGVTVVTGNRAIIVGSGGKEYQVIDVSNEGSPAACGNGVDVDTGIHSVASVLETDGDAYSYIVTGDASSEFKIIAGGPGGQYASAGEFESATFNPGYATANNRFSATYSQPSGTTIRFQVSLANLVSGSCPSTGAYTFVGPDGTSGTYFTPASGTAVAFPFTGTGNYTNPGQCFRYKAYLSTTNVSSTPVLNDFTINYSP